MSLRPEELAAVAAELQAHLVGAVVQKGWAPLPALAYLELRQPGRSVLLCLSAEPELSRLSVTAQRLPTPGEPHPFQRWLRAELVGSKLARVEARGRTALLTFATEGGERVLVLALSMPPSLALTTGEGRLLALSQEASARRTLLPGQPHPAFGAEAAPAPVPSPAPEGAPAAASRLLPQPGAAFPLAEAAEALHAGPERKRRAEAIRRRLAQPYRARLSRLGRTLGKVRQEAGRQQDAERHRQLGELLAQNLYRVPRGAHSVRLTRYSEAGAEEVEVPLDPRRPPKEQVDWHFHQYRRLLRGCEAAGHRLRELEREERTAREALTQLEAMDEEALLSQLEVLARPGAEAAQGPARPFREYQTARGQRIWVGKGGEANAQLTFKVARPHHLWLHARGVPGAHVVVPLERGQTADQETLLDAAHLALHHSDLKGEERGEVSYVPVKYVRSIKGGAPGQVSFTQEKTFLVRMEPERLKRLLATPELAPAP